jgi:hypothetical protein
MTGNPSQPDDDRVSWDDLIDHIVAAHIAGYDLGYAHGRNDRADDEGQAYAHDIAARTVGLTPEKAPPRWAIAS